MLEHTETRAIPEHFLMDLNNLLTEMKNIVGLSNWIVEMHPGVILDGGDGAILASCAALRARNKAIIRVHESFFNAEFYEDPVATLFHEVLHCYDSPIFGFILEYAEKSMSPDRYEIFTDVTSEKFEILVDNLSVAFNKLVTFPEEKVSFFKEMQEWWADSDLEVEIITEEIEELVEEEVKEEE